MRFLEMEPIRVIATEIVCSEREVYYIIDYATSWLLSKEEPTRVVHPMGCRVKKPLNGREAVPIKADSPDAWNELATSSKSAAPVGKEA